MPIFVPTDFYATVVWMGAVMGTESDDLRATAISEMPLSFAGNTLDRHAGETRPACVRVRDLHPKGTEIRNARQLSLVSREELDETSKAMGLDAIDPEWIGASLILEGIDDFTHIPPASRLQADDGTCLIVDIENRPCVLPGRVIEGERPGFGASYKAAAQNRRGVTASVERPGTLRTGDKLRLFIPDQRGWRHTDAVRA